MEERGFDHRFTIYRKRNLYALQFLMYLDGRDSNESTWPDKEDTNVDITLTTGIEYPYGYRSDGDGDGSANLGVSAETITEFTIAAVITRDESTNNDAIFRRLFGDSHYPRMYFTGDTLYCEIKLDNTLQTLSVASVSSYITNGQPALIVFRGDATTGIEILIDGTQRATDSTTGTSYDVGASAFELLKDTNKSYNHTGELRFLAAIAQELTDAQLTTLQSMLEYEGVFDVWRDGFSKYSGTTALSDGSKTALGSTPYEATLFETI